MLGVAFGRLGCFLNGCCFGNVCEGFPGISFPRGSAAYSVHLENSLITRADEASKPVHPTQLYETIVCIGFFFLLSWMWKKKRKAEGELFLIMVMLYGTWRFLVEFIRGDDRPQDAYQASKAAILALSKTLAVMLGPDGIRSNVVVPGPTETSMQAPS